MTLADVDTYSIPTYQAIPVTMKFLALLWLWLGDGLNLFVRVAFHHAFYQISFLEGWVITPMAVSVRHLETNILEFRNSSWLVAWSYHKHSPNHYKQGLLKIDVQWQWVGRLDLLMRVVCSTNPH